MTSAERCQAVDMSQTGLSNRKVAGQMGTHQSVVDYLMHRLQSTIILVAIERLRSCRPRKTTPREGRLIVRCSRRNRFATSARIRNELNFGRSSICKD